MVEDDPVLDDRSHGSGVSDIVEWVRIEDEEVGSISDLNSSNLSTLMNRRSIVCRCCPTGCAWRLESPAFPFAEKIRRLICCREESTVRLHSRLNHVFEFEMNGNSRKCPHIGSE